MEDQVFVSSDHTGLVTQPSTANLSIQKFFLITSKFKKRDLFTGNQMIIIDKSTYPNAPVLYTLILPWNIPFIFPYFCATLWRVYLFQLCIFEPRSHR